MEGRVKAQSRANEGGVKGSGRVIENVIRPLIVFVHKANLNLAFQVMESDLEVRAPR